jgi:hypothetical protein
MVTTIHSETSEDRIANMLEDRRTEKSKNNSGESSGDEGQNKENDTKENVNNLDQVENVTHDDSNDSDEEDQSPVNDEKDQVPFNDSSYKCSQAELDDARCGESIPSSDSNKENVDRNLLPVEFNPSDWVDQISIEQYDNTDQIPLSQLLKIHVKQLVLGFEFGEATKRRAQENMKTARDKKKNENRKSEEVALTKNIEKNSGDPGYSEKPCCSKTLSENDHKTPHSRKRQRLTESKAIINSDKDFCKATRRVPDCLIDHHDCTEVWVYMIYKEEASLKLRNPRVFNDFKSVTPRMRAILLDWLMEVAAVYHLRRVTYYLSVDYFDRFLSIRPDIPKSLLQLVGITCLYIAAKVEEIYPPNLSEFSYVCDGACKSKEIVSCELLILNSLGWEVVSTTPSDWLNLYMQLHFKSSDIVRTALNMDFNKDFIFPQYSAYQFTRASQLMDLLSLDPGFLKFGYSVIAAAAMYFMYGKEIALSVSGLAWEQLKSCVDYMEVFYTIIKDVPDPRLHSCLGGPHPEEMNRFSTGLMERVQSGPQNENYSFQTHVASMDYFEKATIYRLTRQKSQTQATEKHLESTAINDNLKSNTTDFCTVKSIVGNDDNECTDGIEDNENSIPADKCIGSNLIDNITPLEELTKNDDSHDVEASNSEQNLMSLDEIFELILSQDELKNTNSE